ncbi:N-acetylglucosamine/diacetylchitobiose ABC transporter substrate-binding protein [Propionibacteriaceae bacterium Y1700]|uniref:N-acetylglucosamine/diacetylchitobiose ABC transporter substrate-binding protein n=1 Tax=Microlunatus sp. Y1700 TaxID=3418487 RepID=UPI003DA71089
MINQSRTLRRRDFLRGSLVAAALVPMGGALASCASSGTGAPTDENTGDVSADNPFGIAEEGTIDAVIFNGGYGVDYVEFAATALTKKWPNVKATVSPSTDIAGELQPRFVGGTPPDLIDNSGAKAIGINTILAQLEDLSEVIEAPNYEGTPIKDTLYDGVLDAGTYGDKVAELNYVLSVYGVWYSASLFKENGWEPPKTWDEALALGKAAKEKNKFLFCWGKEAASYYLELAISSAIKEGGKEVVLNLANLKDGAWSQEPIQKAFGFLETCVKEGYFKPGGAGTQFTAAQAQWSNAQEALLYPSGAWIENEMKDQTKEGFEMTGVPVMTLSDSPSMPYESLHSAAGEPFIIPSQAANKAGGKEILRAMLSKEAATNFAKEKLAPTVVKDTVPDDGFGSTALVSQIKMLEAAGTNIYHWKFISLYGMNQDQLVALNAFLAGDKDAASLTADLQKISDKVRDDDSIEKIEFS